MEKKKTAKLSELIEYLQGMLDEVGDVETFVLDVTQNLTKEGDEISFVGLTAQGAIMQEASGDYKRFF